MKIHEHQAKDILRRYGVPTPRSSVAFSVDEAVEAANGLGGELWVVKAQIHAGGRGKGGGVKLARSLDEVRAFAEGMLGKPLITHQTGPEGQVVNRILIEEGVDIARELYLGMVLDRETDRIVAMASTEGGVEIEKVAAETPEKILKQWAHPLTGLAPFQARELAFGLGLSGGEVRAATKFLDGLYRAFTENDCSLMEINPLVITGSGDVIALDAKMDFDDNGLFRHPGLLELRDVTEEDAAEAEAASHNLSYVNLSGNIGFMVNGAGLAMATMDIIKHYGGEPANFLDVGGSATPERVEAAFRLILADSTVKGIFVNIFGGIVLCDVVATGIVEAARSIDLGVPLVVRLIGNHEEEGQRILRDSGLPILPAQTMDEGARKILEAIGTEGSA
jgi:succinyl-CoA synthetase beta subunit